MVVLPVFFVPVDRDIQGSPFATLPRAPFWCWHKPTILSMNIQAAVICLLSGQQDVCHHLTLDYCLSFKTAQTLWLSSHSSLHRKQKRHSSSTFTNHLAWITVKSTISAFIPCRRLQDHHIQTWIRGIWAHIHSTSRSGMWGTPTPDSWYTETQKLDLGICYMTASNMCHNTLLDIALSQGKNH